MSVTFLTTTKKKKKILKTKATVREGQKQAELLFRTPERPRNWGFQGSLQAGLRVKMKTDGLL